MKKYLAILLITVSLIGCSDDDPVTPPVVIEQKTIKGSWDFSLFVEGKTIAGILNVTNNSESNFVGTLSLSGMGQVDLDGTLTRTQIHFTFTSMETWGKTLWMVDGTYDLDLGKINGIWMAYKDSDKTKMGEGIWSATR